MLYEVRGMLQRADGELVEVSRMQQAAREQGLCIRCGLEPLCECCGLCDKCANEAAEVVSNG